MTVTRSHRGVWPMKSFLNFIHHLPIRKEVEQPQEATDTPTGEIMSQISFGYKGLQFMVTRLYDAALGKYSVIAKVGDWQKVETGLTEAQAEEFEDGVYAILIPQTTKV